MNKLVLTRIRQDKNNKDSFAQTIGKIKIIVDGEVLHEFWSLELPWKDNAKNVSCIPVGTYPVSVSVGSPSFAYEHIDILDVPERTFIKMHGGNFVHQLLGCVLPGMGLAHIDDNELIDVTSSRKALRQIIRLIKTYDIKEIEVESKM